MDIRESCREKNRKKEGPTDVRNIDRNQKTMRFTFWERK